MVNIACFALCPSKLPLEAPQFTKVIIKSETAEPSLRILKLILQIALHFVFAKPQPACHRFSETHLDNIAS
jgi:hypothetical protein